MIRRTFADAVADISRALSPQQPGELRVTRLEAAVPFDVAIGVHAGDTVDVYGDIPTWRWRTAFDREPGRLTIALVQDLMSEGGEA
jgi:hypothetical protein